MSELASESMSLSCRTYKVTEIGLQHEITQFYYQEARSLDDRLFEEWLELFDDDVHYYMPVRTVRYERESDQEFSRPDEVSHFEETKVGLGQRVARIRSGMAWAEDPPSRTRHLVANVLISDTDEPDVFRVRTAFLLFRGRLDREADYFPGERVDVLRRSADAAHGWTVLSRRILLDHTLILSKNLSVFF